MNHVEVDLAGVGLRLGGRDVLRSITWRIRSGERWVLMGANGAGKTQLLKLVAGDVWPTPGRGRRHYRWKGEHFDEPLGVKDEIAYVGAERQDRYEHYQWNHRVLTVVGTGLTRSDAPQGSLNPAQREQAQRFLARLGIKELAARRFLTLSYGQRRLVLLARALAQRPRLLLLDELLNGLDAVNRPRVLALLRQLSRGALPWVLSTHRVEDIPPFATHLCLLDRGRIRWSGPIAAAPAVQAGKASSVPSRRRQSAAGGPILISVRNGWVWLGQRAVLRRLDFSIRRGECWVVHGANGSGKSTLMRALHGDLGVASQGELRRRGIEAGVPLEEFKRRVGLVAPELQANHPLHLRVLDVVASGLAASIGLVEEAGAAQLRRARALLRRFGLASLAERTLRALSYGQLRRVLFARAWMAEPAILLLDEPYTGLDVRTRRVLMREVERAAARGVTIVLTSHHRDEWPASTTHEIELAGGNAVYCGVLRHPTR